MRREFEPGDVAIVPFGSGEHRAILDEDGTWLVVGKANSRAYSINRPLVVIDPENREQVTRLWEAVEAVPQSDTRPLVDVLRDALRILVAPPKPTEPTGLGAVVEDDKGVKWIRTHDTLAPWLRHNFTGSRYWSDVAAVRVLSEGVTP